MKKFILVTGGTGFIGSHLCVALLEKGYNVIILDSFVNSSPKVEKSIKKICSNNKNFNSNNLKLLSCDLRNNEELNSIFETLHKDSIFIEAVIHLAGLKSVKESMINPMRYWDFNVKATINLLKTMEVYGCKKLVFSSSATIYGILKERRLINEKSEIKPINVYGKTKQIIEDMLIDLSVLKKWEIISLRYFNPIGSHPSGYIGENSLYSANNIMPLLNQVGLGKREIFEIYGNDWDTKDGTCIRDYIHVIDLANGHVRALEHLLMNGSKFLSINLGTGLGVSVLELINKFQEVNQLKIPFKFVSRRKGDVPYLVADNSFAKEILNWNPNLNLDCMCKDSWNWFRTLNN